MGDTMHLLDIGLFALALWLVWYAGKAGHAFCDLRDMHADQARRERLFLGLHRPKPGQGRAQPYGDRFTRAHEVSPSWASGLHEAAPPPYTEPTYPPFVNSYERACVMGNHDMWCEEEAEQAVLRG